MLSRNKVAVPEGAAGTPPFWRGRSFRITSYELRITSFNDSDTSDSIRYDSGLVCLYYW